ncbi:MAG: T9SS type A sorting domain-containing protein [Bacteroidales bacterium]|nr:T9SS type A sorting domain-containing protein [Bacteroidales bacterium]
MKSKELLLGLFAGLLLCFSAVADAQTKANYNVSNLQEIGPENIGGRVSALLMDGETIYAGTALGGLYKKTAANAFDRWHFMPCYLPNGSQLTLPITSLVKNDAGVIFIGTGEKGYVLGNDTAAMASRGRGLWKLQDETFTQLIDPADNGDFYFINELSIYESGAIHRQFAATENGLYTTTDDWATSTKVFDGAVRDLEIVPTRKILYFTTPGAIYRISNVENDANVQAPICITVNESLFAEAGGNIKIAVAPSDARYFYAMVFTTEGTFTGVYLSKDQQTWLKLNTSSVKPFSSLRNGENCGSITVDAVDPKIIYIGGETIWTGRGYIEDAIFQWTNNSYSESSLNMGDYMSYVYNNPMAVHSGIKQILQDGESFFVATNGGVYHSVSLNYFENISFGLNATPVVDFAICPDGSLIMGATDLACPFLASRSGADDAEVNHSANVIFAGSGGPCAASRFQRALPTPARGLMVSADDLQFGRTYNDYSDYTQTQTWTTGEGFFSNVPGFGYNRPALHLWETMNNTEIKDSLTVTIDTLGFVIRGDERIQLNKKDSMDNAGRIIDSVFNSLPFTIQAGDKMVFSHPSFFGYPFEYTFTEDFVLTNSNMKLKVQSPYHSRAMMTAKYRSGAKFIMSAVLMAWNPMDFRRVWSSEEHGMGNYSATMEWAKLFIVNSTDGYNIRHVAMSRNGDAAYAAVSDSANNSYFILRTRGLNSIELNDTNSAVGLYFNYLSPNCQMIKDTLMFNGSTNFARPVTSMNIDQRDGKDCLVVTFGGYDDAEPNVVVFDNASQASYTAQAKSVAEAKIPVYSAMVEYTTGEVYVGTEDGVFVASASSFAGTPSWETYGEFNGVPVTAIHQQTDTLKSIALLTHNGINEENNVFVKTKYPYAMYFGTYGRGIFMDKKYVTDTSNTVVDPGFLGVPEVVATGKTSVSIYPNPTSSQATIDINLSENANTMVRVFDMSGKVVFTENLGRIDAGNHKTQLNCQNLRKGIYIVNVVSGKATATSKLVVR